MAEILKRFFWKLWIIPNRLTKDDDTDGIAEVSTVNNTANNEEIARRIVAERSEYRHETIVNILKQRDALVRTFIKEGRSFMDENIRMAPRVKGNWFGLKPTPDYSVHTATIDAIPTNVMRSDLAEVGFQILGYKETSGIISLVTDTVTGLADGTITPNDDIRITGEKIRILDNGTDNPEIGVFFVAADGARNKVTRRLTDNNPSTVTARVPMLAPGVYTLEIVTYYTTGTVMLTSPRTIMYNLPLTVL